MTEPNQDIIWERWDEVDSLFGEALGVALEDRPTFLNEACGADRELLDTVSRLLDSSDRASQILTGPGTELLRAAFGDPTRPDEEGAAEVGQVVGRYRIVREIGRGGMATVYEAERADGAYQQRVALKVLRGVDSGDVASRFLAERQILSSLAHPNIAQLLDGGTAEGGVPYLAMELVEGESITRWADGNRATISRRLNLFQQVVAAVQFAHAHLVVHRDIKPSNVLVGEDGRVRLLDFGIAKLLESRGEESPKTQPMTRWMTPEYAAPEQILAQPITTATDVYSLGVLLFELLTGTRPFGDGSLSGFQLERAICEETPPLPSEVVGPSAEATPLARGTTPTRLARILAGDLDAIVSKALRKRPEARYRSPQELWDDLERYRKGLPVLAREGLWAYRVRKFARRHRVGVAAAGVIGLVLAGSSVILASQRAETIRQRDRATEAALLATAEAENSQMVIDFLADVFRGRNPGQAPSDTLTARELLEWGTQRVETEFSERPAVQASLFLVLGNAHHNLGLLDEGVELLERSVALRRDVFGEESGEVADALLALGGVHRNNRDFSFALVPLREALSIRRETPVPEEVDVAAALEALGTTFRDAQQPDSAEAFLREALEIRARYPQMEAEYTAATLGLAYVLRGLGRLDEAATLYEEGIPSFRKLPDRSDADLAVHINNLAYLQRTRGEYVEAESLYREAFDLVADVYGRGHPTTLTVSANLASILNLLGQPDEYLALLRQRTEDANAQWPEGHWRVGQAYLILGDAQLRSGSLQEAEASASVAGTQFEEALGPRHNWTSFAWARIAAIRLLTGEEAAGLAFLDRLHAWLEQEREERGGALSNDSKALVEPFLAVLEAVGLEAEHRRFGALVEG